MDTYWFIHNIFPYVLIIAVASAVFIGDTAHHYMVANPPFNTHGGFDLNYGLVDQIYKRNSTEFYASQFGNDQTRYAINNPNELNANPTGWGFI